MADALWVGSMPEAYDRWLEPVLFRPYGAELARRAAQLAPRDVLELAAGTGALTKQLLAALDVPVIATDLNPAMIQVGSSRAPGATWRPADALDLPFGDDEFDLVACQFGVMFFPDKPAGYAEVRRVLRPGGRFLFTTWDTVEENAFAAALVDAITGLFPDDPPAFVLSVPHGYADMAKVEADLIAAGFRIEQAERLVLDGTATSAADIARGLCHGTPLRLALEPRGDLEELTLRIASAMELRLGSGPVAGKLAAHVVQATPTA